MTGQPKRMLVIACGALLRELRAVLGQLEVDTEVAYLPAHFHNRPEKIAPAVEQLILTERGNFAQIVVAYGDCGTGGHLDAVLERHGVDRVSGPHCYSFFAGEEAFALLHEGALGTFFLTDYLARHFEQLIIVGLGIDRHPSLRDMYFGNYTRLVLLSQTESPELLALGQAAADRLGLAFEHRHTGLEPFANQVRRLIPVRNH